MALLLVLTMDVIATELSSNLTKVNMNYVPKHKRLLKQCGIHMASLYLKNRGYTAEQAVSLLLK